ncbi:hypothetical protein J7E26_02020 [Bacillus sp. ISL-51]|nr:MULTISPECIES: hypothetical protein [Bacteria]MBT2572740.1 hypothetical protein [Bacillus sp. ISL-51]MBT2635535.1 hypothetical protein [Bacillus sp. ISL-26]MBT2713210.1 hypothetical protein [Pseudomonas sp. ISL-88]
MMRSAAGQIAAVGTGQIVFGAWAGGPETKVPHRCKTRAFFTNSGVL